MGTAMALNLRRKFPVMVWNRTESKYGPLIEAGATVGKTPSQVIAETDLVFTMLFDDAAIQSVMDTDKHFTKALRGKTLINTSSVSVEFSHKLAQQVREAGGNFLEMPVSGSKIPAEQGQLVGMVAGDSAVFEQVKPVFEPITCSTVYFGPVGSGLKAKYAVNLFLVTILGGLAESMNLARALGLSLEALGEVLDSGPLASAYSKMKIAKLLKEDWSPQATVVDCYNSTELTRLAALEVNVQTPLILANNSLYRVAKECGLGEEDCVAAYKVLAQFPDKYSPTK